MGPLASLALDKVKLGEPPSSEDYRRALAQRVPQLAGLVGFGVETLRNRIERLIDIGRRDLGLARLVEGHLDALSILIEANQQPAEGAVYAIWASGGPLDTTRIDGLGESATLSGTKAFCSGAALVDRALVWVAKAERLVEIALPSDRVTWDDCAWQVDAMAGVATWTGHFDAVPLARQDWAQAPGWYFRRAGFWRGALCPAACWLGGALGLIDYARRHANAAPLAERQLGLLHATSYSMQASLLSAASETTHPATFPSGSYPRALAARHAVESGCLRLINEFSRLFGPRPLVHDPGIARRIQELSIYVRQCHGDKDLAQLGATGRDD